MLTRQRVHNEGAPTQLRLTEAVRRCVVVGGARYSSRSHSRHLLVNHAFREVSDTCVLPFLWQVVEKTKEMSEGASLKAMGSKISQVRTRRTAVYSGMWSYLPCFCQGRNVLASRVCFVDNRRLLLTSSRFITRERSRRSKLIQIKRTWATQHQPSHRAVLSLHELVKMVPSQSGVRHSRW